MTRAGVLTPRSEPEEPRHPRVTPIEFHENGQVARVAVEKAVPSPLGPIAAELITFHPDGGIKRLFPTNGKLGAFWSEEDERPLVPVLRIPTNVGTIEARFISIAFYADGGLRSLTLWPSERVSITSPLGPLSIRQGVSFRRDGALESCEPARPIDVPTPLGPLRAYDPQPIGLNADANSLVFDAQGAVAALVTDRDSLVVTEASGTLRRFTPSVAAGDCADACATGEALRVQFDGTEVALRLGATRERPPLDRVVIERPDDGRRHLPCVG